jgi:hypothetical protein
VEVCSKLDFENLSENFSQVDNVTVGYSSNTEAADKDDTSKAKEETQSDEKQTLPSARL